MTAVLRPQGGRLVDQFEYGLDAPICLTWELTYACNLACVHCLSSSSITALHSAVVSSRGSRRPELDRQCTHARLHA